jgi:DNA replication protein DnaC
MNSSQNNIDIEKRFLEEMATKYQLFDEYRRIFLCRFDRKNAELQNKEIADDKHLGIDEQELQKYLRSICDLFGHKANKRGRPKGDESPWKNVFDDLWNKKFNEWLKLQQNPNVQIPILNNDEWLQVCHTKLENQQQEIRRKASAMGFELDFPPVPLGLVERKQQQRRDEDVDRRDVYQLEKEVIAKIYEHNDFLEQVINQNPTGKNKHIAIVGEPGAGKTTLLSAVASYIKDKTSNLPIFISLGSLEKMTLEKYLLEKWLPHAMRLVNQDFKPTSEIEEQLKSRFYKSDVWLLLDGVDEMGEFSPGEALRKISQALTDWLGQARVVLTCRLNVWDASLTNNELPGFDTYKTQQFKPEDVDKFIEEWFKCDENKIQCGEELKAKLREPGKERIYELVTNPLRLSLLCQIFYQSKHSDLPETKAELFGLYTRHLYYWKRKLVPQNFNYTLKQELHQALGRLALAGIDSDARFRLNESLAVKEMGQDLFDLACDVGWLNLVDREANSNEAVYAFFHPNFQEYFAALVIDDWHYFLNHNNDNPNPFIKHNNQDCVYRIFEGKWKEVILLWFGLARNKVSTDLKEDLMKELINFQDGCTDFYMYQSYFLAVAVTSEFSHSNFTDEIIEQVIKWTFSNVNNQKNNYRISAFLEKEFKKSLIQANSNRLIHGLTKQLLSNQVPVNRLEIALILLEKLPDSQLAVEIIVDYLDKCQEEYNRTKRINLQSILVKSKLEKLAPSNPLAISTLARLLSNQNQHDQNSQIPSKLNFNSLFQLPTVNRNDIENFISLLAEIDMNSIKQSILKINDVDTLIGLTGKKLILKTSIHELGHLNAIVNVLDRLNSNYDDISYGFIQDINSVSIDRLVEIASSNSTVIPKLMEMFHSSKDIKSKNKVLTILGTAASKNIDATVALMKILQTTEDYVIGMNAIYFIKKIFKKDLLKVVVQGLKIYMEDIEVYEILWHCAQNMTYPEFYRAWHGEPPLNNLENQFTDTHSLLSQLEPTQKTGCIPIINTANIQLSDNEHELVKLLCTRIWKDSLKLPAKNIPKISDVADLERELLVITEEVLQKQNLALVFNEIEPNAMLINICRKLANAGEINIALITKQPLDAPLKGFPPNQLTLLSAIQTWISEID